MKKIVINALTFLSLSIAVGSVQAHDPSMHMTKAEKPKCEALGEMDHSNMKENDPVTLAMMKKCSNEHSAEGHDSHTKETAGMHSHESSEAQDKHSSHNHH